MIKNKHLFAGRKPNRFNLLTLGSKMNFTQYPVGLLRTSLFGIFLFSIMLLSIPSIAQPFGNEWIDYNQSYYKFKVGKNGLYRITQFDLNNVGFPTSSIDPRRIQIFKNGVEQAIFVQGQSDGVFHSSDYIDFYGEINDGKTDTDLYLPSTQPHTLYNIFSDSSVYFLTYKLSNVQGKRMETFSENNVSNIPAEPYYLEDILKLQTSNYFEGKSYGGGNYIILPQYDIGEGFTGSAFATGQSRNFTFTNIDNTVTDEVKPQLEVLLVGRNNNQHSIEVFVGADASNLRTLTTANFDKDDNFLISTEIEWSDISASGELLVRTTANGVGGQADRASVSYTRLTFSRAFEMSGQSDRLIALKTNGSGKSYIEVANPPSDPSLHDITDPSNPVIIGINESFQALNAVISNTNIAKKLWLQSLPTAIGTIEPITFQNIDNTLYDYLIITNEVLQIETDTTDNAIVAYKTYRESTLGGSHTVLIQNIQNIYEQFNYGLPSPIAIRRYCDYMLDNAGNPQYLFLIGRATNVFSNYYRQPAGTANIENLVPTYGHPGSDMAFTAGLDGTIIEQAIATGRLNAATPDDVQVYLNKVMDTESQSIDNLRKKSLIQLSGGLTEGELNAFAANIDGFKSIAEAPLLGGITSQKYKDSNNAVELINIAGEINQGVMLVTFFGHSSTGITDIEVGTVSNPVFGYANQGKYPVFLVNGCNAGDFYGNAVSFGIDWILTPNLGALGFIAHSDQALSGSLRNYTNLFYSVAFSDQNFIGRSLGAIMKETARRYAQNFGVNESSIGQLQLFNLQGDPAIKLFGAEKADYHIIDNNFVTGTYDGAALLVDTDSFYVDINIKNYGIVPPSPLKAIVRRTLTDGSRLDSEIITFDPILNSDTIRIVIDNQIEGISGNNTFEIILDPLEEIDELNEQNNSLTFDLFFATGSTQNLFPTDYGVSNDANTVFIFQSTDLLSGTRQFQYELDTLSSFNSTFLMQQTITANVVGQISIDLNASGNIADGTVFYWRTKFTNPTADEDDNWVVSSFTLNTTASPASWSQGNPVQFKDIELTGLSLDTLTGIWDFFSNTTKLDITTYGPNFPNFNLEDTKVLIDNSDVFNSISTNGQYVNCRNNTINFITFHNQSTIPINPIKFNIFDVTNKILCGKRPQFIFSYQASEFNEPANPLELIDAINQGDQVAIFSLGQINYSTWTDAFKSKLEELGINRATLDNLQDGEPIILLGEKGSVNAAIEITNPNLPKNEQEVILDTNITGSFGKGSLKTQKIGPATQWSSLENQIDFSSNPADDVKNISIIGITDNNQEVTLIADIQTNQADLSSIVAATYPYIKLKVDLEDPQEFTAPQLRNWQVYFTQAPEGILLNRNVLESQAPISKQEGENLLANFTFWNLSNADFADSVKVNYEVLNSTSGLFVTDSINIKPLAAGDSIGFELSIKTLNIVGSNDLTVTLNKNNDQTEITNSNNSIRLRDFFSITADNTNPILDVSFDGVYILDGDIISPNPNILIKLTDENQFILKTDTTGVNLFLKEPCDGCEFERIAFNSPNVIWTPAAADNDFSIEYRPENLLNGMHAFRVQAQDASGNDSGLQPYEISFEIINESTVTNFYPYPNPFSTSTRFVFTLTGSEIPEDIKIQIMTVTGRVVKEIFRQELGAIRIGNNITEYAWDGRDQYGDLLANGVYLYRVIIRQNGESLQNRKAGNKSAGDEGYRDIDGRAFKNGFGKMYILR